VDDWLSRCATVLETLCSALRSELQDICQLSSPCSLMTWTAYDQLMLGHMKMDSVREAATGAMMLLCHDYEWSCQASAQVVQCLDSTLKRVKCIHSHYCTVQSKCSCIDALLREMWHEIVLTLTCPRNGMMVHMFRAQFIKLQSSGTSGSYVSQVTWKRIWTLLMLCQRSRADAQPLLCILNEDMLHYIHDLCIVAI
jgi:hypothetical protein